MESGVCFDWYQVCGTCFSNESGFSNESDLIVLGAAIGRLRGFPPWRQRTGSAVLEGSERGDRLGRPREVTPVQKTPPAHRQPPSTTTSGLLQPWWTPLRMIRTQPPSIPRTCGISLVWVRNSLDEQWHRQYAPAAVSATEVRSKISKSENTVPPLDVNRRAASPVRDQSTPNSLNGIDLRRTLLSRHSPSPC